MNLDDLAQRALTLFNELVIHPLEQFMDVLDGEKRFTLYVLLGLAAVSGFAAGRRRTSRPRSYRTFGGWRFPVFQNSGEARVSRVLMSHFGHPDYHLMNHVTLRIGSGTTQVDHILVSRFGVFVIETKDFSGWIFADASSANWTQVLYRRKSSFQNPLFQNGRHVRAVEALLNFVPPEAVRSVVVFCGYAEFRTDTPDRVVTIDELVDHVRQHTEPVMSPNRMQLCVGRLETARLAISGKTDVEHVQNLSRWGRA